MIISVPLAILNLLFWNGAHTASAFNAPASFTTRSTTATESSTHLQAVESDDKYASLLDAYQKKKGPSSDLSFSTPPPSTPTPPDVVPDLSTVTDVPSVDDPVPNKVDDILSAIDSATSSAIDASQQAAQAAASISNSYSPSSYASEAASASADKAPSLAEYFSRLSTGQETGGVGGLAPDAKENFLKLQENVVTSSANVKSAVSQVAAGAKAGVEPGKAPSLLDFMSGKPGDIPSIPPDSKEKLVLLKQNLVGAAGVGAVSGSTPQFESVDMSKLVENLHLDEYGAWYVTALTLFYAVKQKEAGKLEAEKEFEKELALARARADEAANAAVMAAEGAKKAKDLMKAVELDGLPEGENIGKKLLEDSRVRQLEVSNDMMMKDLQLLKMENASQKEMITSIMGKKAAVKVSKTKEQKPVKLEIPVGKSVMERDPDEDKKILSILKDMDVANAEKKAKEVKPKRKKAVRKKKASVAKTTTTVAKTAPPKKKKAVRKKKAASKKTAAKKKTEVEAFAVEESSTDKVIEDIEAAEESFNEAMAESMREADMIAEIKGLVAKPNEDAPTPAASKPKKKRASPTTQKAAAPVEAESNPWGKLKESTLKRKTIAQLSEYLNERQITIEGLSKKELVGTIQSL